MKYITWTKVKRNSQNHSDDQKTILMKSLIENIFNFPDQKAILELFWLINLKKLIDCLNKLKI